MDEFEYLSPGFEPSNLKIAELRNLLLKHDVPYPSTAKKPELVTLFDRNIKANAESILAQHKKVKPSARGIQNVPGLVDVPSPATKKAPGRKKTAKAYDDSETEEVKETEIEFEAPVKGGKKSRGIKKAMSTASTLSEVDQDGFVMPLPKEEQTPPPGVPSTPTSPGRRGRTPKKKVTALSEITGDPSASESDVGPSVKTPKRAASSKAAKKSVKKPDIKKESTVESQDFSDVNDRNKIADDFDFSLTPRDKSPFSDYNPFQKGTDTSPELKDKKHNRRGRSKSRERTPTRSTTATSASSELEGYNISPIGLSPQQLIKKFMSPPPAPSDTAGGSSTKSKSGRRRSRLHSPEKIEMEVFSWSSIFLVLLIPFLAWGLWHRYATIKVGFCDDDGSLPIDHSLPDKFPDENESADSGIFARFSPKCTPCPFHGLCDEGKLIGCDDGFIPHRPIHALGGLIPHLELCRPDTVKQQAIVQIAEAILYDLSVHAGKVICSTMEVDDDAPDWEKNGGMRLDQLWNLQEQARDRNIDHEKFREYWDLATRDLMRRPEQIDVIEQASSLTGKPDIIFISKQPKLWFSCRARKDALRALYEYRYHAFGSVFFALSLWVSYAYVQVLRQDKRRVAVLVHTVLGHLADQERLHYVDNVQTPHPYLAITQLRDLLLQDEPNRDRLWHKVERVVVFNSNVRERVGEIRGEQHLVWEWVGSSIASPSTTPPGSSTNLAVDEYGSPVPYPAAEIVAAGNGLYPNL